jgi:RNA polymerase sigma-70 factor (ECF subfamily)
MENLCAELTECIPDTSTVGEEYESRRLREELNSFLYSCSKERRAMFILRYFHSMSTLEIAARLSVSESKVKTTLYRLRRDLQKFLEEQELL